MLIATCAQDKQVIKDLTKYIAQKSTSNPSLAPLAQLLADPENPPSIGLILTERLINIPAEVVPPMYTMLQEEITWALEEKEPYNFSHYIILSKTYEEVESKLDVQESRPQKKKKKTPGIVARSFISILRMKYLRGIRCAMARLSIRINKQRVRRIRRERSKILELSPRGVSC